MMTHEYCPMKTILKTNEEIRRQAKTSDTNRRKQAISILREEGIHEDVIKRVEDSLQSSELQESCRSLNSKYKLKTFCKHHFFHLPIQTIEVNGQTNVISFISLKDTLVGLLKDPTLKDCLRRIPNYNPNVISDVQDGKVFRDNPYFKKHPNAIKIQLYSDCIEVTNPLGAARGNHKLLMVYWSLLDVPKHHRSQVDHIFVTLIAKYNSTKHQLQDVFKPVLQDLKQLEEGVLVDGELIRAGLLIYSADNLEAHEIAGIQTHFNSGYVCRFCKIKHNELGELEIPGFLSYPKMTLTEYDRAVSLLENEQTPQSPEVADEGVCDEILESQDETNERNEQDQDDDNIEESSTEGTDAHICVVPQFQVVFVNWKQLT